MLHKKIDHKKILSKVKDHTKQFKIEFNKSMLTAILAAFGLLIALVWKDVITELVNALTALSPAKSKLVYALIVTVVSVIGILICTKLFSPRPEKKMQRRLDDYFRKKEEKEDED